MALDDAALLKEWQALSKDWYSIYQWARASRAGYTELIAGWIDREFPGIRLATEGLRQRPFRVSVVTLCAARCRQSSHKSLSSLDFRSRAGRPCRAEGHYPLLSTQSAGRR